MTGVQTCALPICWLLRFIIPVSHAYSAHEVIAGSRLEIITGSGHFPHVEAPERFLGVLTDFLNTTEPAMVDGAGLQTVLQLRAIAGA